MRRAQGSSLIGMILMFWLTFAAGCAMLSNRQTTLVPPGTVLKAGPGMTGRVYVRTAGEWRLSDDKVEIPEGYYLVPPETAK